jgi:hypothetical protein
MLWLLWGSDQNVTLQKKLLSTEFRLVEQNNYKNLVNKSFFLFPKFYNNFKNSSFDYKFYFVKTYS